MFFDRLGYVTPPSGESQISTTAIFDLQFAAAMERGIRKWCFNSLLERWLTEEAYLSNPDSIFDSVVGTWRIIRKESLVVVSIPFFFERKPLYDGSEGRKFLANVKEMIQSRLGIYIFHRYYCKGYGLNLFFDARASERQW